MATSLLQHNMHTFASTTDEIIGSSLESGATILFTIPTRSMLPTLAPGDRVLVRGIRAGEAHVGDILLIRSGLYWLAHRLTERRQINGNWSFVTQGDYGVEPDRIWSSEQICGKIIRVERTGLKFSLESSRARWFGIFIAYLLRRRLKIAPVSGAWNSLGLKINAALVRGAVSLARAPIR